MILTARSFLVYANVQESFFGMVTRNHQGKATLVMALSSHGKMCGKQRKNKKIYTAFKTVCL